jgi:Replication protein
MNSRYAREIHTPDAATSRAGMVQKDTLRRQAQTVLHVNDGRRHQDQHRTCWCARHSVTEGGMPVFRRLDGGKARLAKVKTCGSVWACPVCAAKVAEKRRCELTYAMVQHQARGGHAYLLTFTFPHYFGQALADLMAPFDKARQSFQNAKGWKKLMGTDGTAGRVGGVTSLEVTYGAGNGWHPHLHMLVFCKAGAFEEGPADEQGRLSSKAIDYFRAQWVRQLEKRGLVDGGNRGWAGQYALDVRGGEKAAEYIAKWGHEERWGLSSELTSSHAKTGKRDTWGSSDHYTPFQLLELSATGDGHATCAFREFVHAFDGKRMLTWSPGLKDHFGIADMSDEDAAAEAELTLNDEHQVGEISQEQLSHLIAWGQQGHFLAFVAEHGHQENPQRLIDEWIAACGGGQRRKGNYLWDRLKIGDHSYFHVAEEVQA